MKNFVELVNLGKTFETPRGPQVVVKAFDLRIRKGEIVALIGHSGCGKSTVLSIIAGLTASTEGGVVLDGREIMGAGPDRGVVFQAPSLLPWMTARDNVALGVRQVMPKAEATEINTLAERVLGWVGLAGAIDKHPSELSLGMQQRVGIARALALSPKLLLLDEPFGMLDSLTRMELQELLLGLVEAEQRTAILVTHDVDEALFMSDRIVMMTSGPSAHVGGVLEVPFVRPRRREDVLDHPRYYDLRSEIIAFLDSQGHRRAA